MPSRAPCVHCGIVRQVHSYRVRQSQLCRDCYRVPELRQKYPPIIHPDALDGNDAMTQEEVDALVAAQMADKPSWWDECDRKFNAAESDDSGRRVAGVLRFFIGRRVR